MPTSGMPTLWWLQLKGWPIGGEYTQIPQRPWGFYGSHDLVTFQSKALHCVVAPMDGEQRWEEASPSSVFSLNTLGVSLEGWERPGGMIKKKNHTNSIVSVS